MYEVNYNESSVSENNPEEAQCKMMKYYESSIVGDKADEYDVKIKYPRVKGDKRYISVFLSNEYRPQEKVVLKNQCEPYIETTCYTQNKESCMSRFFNNCTGAIETKTERVYDMTCTNSVKFNCKRHGTIAP